MYRYQLTRWSSPRWIAIFLLNLCLLAPTQAAFVSIQNFDDLPLGPLHNQDGWSTTAGSFGSTDVDLDPAGGPNQVGLFVGDSSANNNSAFAGTAITYDTTGTLFFRMQISNSIFGSDISFGLGEFANDFQSQLLFNPNGFGIRDGFTNINFDQTLVADTWYNVWVVLDNTAFTSSVFVQGGTFFSQTQLTSGGGSENSWEFSSAGVLDTFLVQGESTNQEALFLDDIYVDNAGQNLVNPIPEPTSSVLAIAGASLLLLRRGRSKKAAI